MTPSAPRYRQTKPPDRLNATRGDLSPPREISTKKDQQTRLRLLQQQLQSAHSSHTPIPNSELLRIENEINSCSQYPNYQAHLRKLLRKFR